MWDPQRKKDLFLIETKPLFALHKILFVLQKKKRSTGSHFSHLQNFLNCYQTSKMLSRILILEAYNFLSVGGKILCSLTAILCWVIILCKHNQLYEKFHVLRCKQGHKNKLLVIIIILQSSLSVWTPLYYGQFPICPDKIIVIFPKKLPL